MQQYTNQDATLAPRVSAALEKEYGFKTTPDGWMRRGMCPNCGKKELYTHSENPWVVRCGRLNNCGWESTARDLFPDLYRDLSKRNPPTKEQPNATADAYLRDVRGFNISLFQGWYSQGRFWHEKGTPQGSHTVRWIIDGLRDVYMERLIDPVSIQGENGSEIRKAHFHGSHKGRWWQPPGFAPELGTAVYIVEGIIDAMSLCQAGQLAVAALSCVNYPSESLKHTPNANDIVWVVALDNDKAGRDHTQKFVARLKKDGYKTAAALCPQGERGKKQDWNDALLRGDLSQEKWLDTLKEARHRGDLLLAKSAPEKANILYKKNRLSKFWFEFDNRLWWCDYDHDKMKKELEKFTDAESPDIEDNTKEPDEIELIRRAGLVREIANCYPECLYHEVSSVNDEMNRYYMRIGTPLGRKVNAAFTASHLASASEFKKRLLAVSAGAMWWGSNQQLDTYLKTSLNKLASIEVFDATGYSDKHKAWIFHQFAVQNGKLHTTNSEDYIQLGRDSVKTASGLHLDLSANPPDPNWLRWIVTAWGAQGTVVTAYWLASLFAQQIRGIHGSFPFLELVGQAGGGKSTLLEFLWRLFGRDGWEGFDPNKSSLAARSRLMAQASNLPIVLIESDRESDQTKRFSWDEFKTAYNGRAISSRGVKTGGNEVYEPPFRGALVISQNAPIEGSEAILSRIVGVTISRAGHTEITAKAVHSLINTELGQVSGVLLDVVKREKEVLDTFAADTAMYRKWFVENGIKMTRIALNYAQIACFIDLLHRRYGLTDAERQEAFNYMAQSAIEREATVGDDPPALIEFWELYEFLNGDTGKMNHSTDPNRIAINLNHLYEVANQHRLPIAPMKELRRLLKGSRRHKFIGIEMLRTSLAMPSDARHEVNPMRQLRCWVFSRKT